MRSSTLALASFAATLTVAAGLVTTSAAPSLAAGETCRGLSATIVGDPGGSITGTDGDDVVVTNGADVVETGDGDDTVCVTRQGRSGTGLVDVGAGDDVVDTSAGTAGTVLLGSGADTFAGGPGNDQVVSDGDGDVVDGGGGDDVVASGLDLQPNTDQISITGGSVQITGVPAAGARFDGGGSAVLVLGGLGGRGTWELNAGTKKVAYRGTTIAEVTGFSTYEIEAPGRKVRFLGTNGDDDVTLDSPVAVNTGAGRDHVALHLDCTSAAGKVPVVVGGPSRDLLEIDSCASGVRIDLEKQYLKPTTSTKAKTQARPRGFENVAAFSQKVRLAGSRAPETMVAFGCDVEIRGDDGNDKLGYRRGTNDVGVQDDYFRGCSNKSTARIFGGNGNDRLYGGLQDQTAMIGGSGRDQAFGGGPRDTCQAEVRKNCTKP